MRDRSDAAARERPGPGRERAPARAPEAVAATADPLLGLQRSAGNRAVSTLLARMPYDSLAAGRYYRVRGSEDVLYLKERHRARGCRFARHEGDLLTETVAVPSFDDVEREATAAEITAVRATRLLRVHARTLAEVDAINRTLTENVALIRARALPSARESAVIAENRALSQRLSGLLDPVIAALYGTATDYEGLRLLMGRFLRGELPGTPWSSGRLMPESSAIAGHLQLLTEMGLVTYESQPSGASQELPGTGGVREHQNAYLEISGPRELMGALRDQVERANARLARQITVVRPGTAAALPLRTLVGPSRPAVEAVVRGRAPVVREGGSYVARMPVQVRNDGRYQQRLRATSAAVARAVEGHVTLVLVSSTFRDDEATVLFDDVVDLVNAAVREVAALGELTPEEAGVSHLTDL